MKISKEVLIAIVRKYKFFILVLMVGILFLAAGSGGNEKTAAQKEVTSQASFDLAAFEKNLGEKLTLIDGAGRVEIMLSLASGEESVFASDVKEASQYSENGGDITSDSENYERSTTIVSSGSYGQEPVLLKTVYPEFKGAVVICDGADNSKVCLKITEAVTALCGISSDNISINKMKK